MFRPHFGAFWRALARFFVPGKYPIHTISDMVFELREHAPFGRYFSDV
jgi:hypothetical protein